MTRCVSKGRARTVDGKEQKDEVGMNEWSEWRNEEDGGRRGGERDRERKQERTGKQTRTCPRGRGSTKRSNEALQRTPSTRYISTAEIAMSNVNLGLSIFTSL